MYGAAVVLYELLAGQLPYPGQSVGQVLRAQLTTTPAVMSSLRADVGPELDAVLARGLATDPDDRYASVAEWADALRAIRDDLGDAGATVARPGDQIDTHTNLAGVAGAAAAAGTGGVAAAAGGAAAEGRDRWFPPVRHLRVQVPAAAAVVPARVNAGRTNGSSPRWRSSRWSD